MGRWYVVGRVVLAVAVLASSAWADVVVLSDGTRLVGSVQRLGDGKLVVGTRMLGTVTVDASSVVTLRTDETVNVAVTTGDRLVGVVAPSEAGDKAVVTTALGPITVDMAQMAAVWPVDGKSPERVAAEVEIAAAKKAVEAARGKWSLTVEAGAVAKEGNSDVQQARGRIDLKHKTDKELLAFYLSGVYAKENKVRSSAEGKLGSLYEYMLSKRWFTYARGELEYDEFENLDLRLSLAGGGGYYWIKADDHELKTRVGLGYLHEDFMDIWVDEDVVILGERKDTLQLDIGLDYRKQLTKWLQVTHSATYYPTFEGLDDYRLVFDTGLVMPLASSKVWKLKLGALQEYDSIPQPGLDRLDQTYYANLMLDLLQN